MKKGKNINDISDELKRQIPKLKPGQIVEFQMLNGVPNPEPDPKERAKQGDLLFGKVQLMTSYRIYDKYKDEYVDVACVQQWNPDGTPAKLVRFIPGLTNGNLPNLVFGGRFSLIGGKVSDEELYEVLWLSPERKGSPCEDPSFEIKFEIIDHTASTKVAINKVDNLKKVIAILDELTVTDARRIMAALNQPSYQDDKTMMAKLKDLAISPQTLDQFLRTYNNKDTYIKSDIKNAMDNGVMSYELKTGDIKLGGVTVANIKTENMDGFIDAFVQWINTAENGKDVYNNIRNQLIKKQEVV